MSGQENHAQLGRAVIFSGPHGVGKDTLARMFRQIMSAEPVVRHITRPASPSEVNGEDYHFISDQEFSDMIGRGAFIEHATYPDCMSGTSYAELLGALGRAEFASFASNFEDSLALLPRFQDMGIAHTSLFVGPVSLASFREGSDQYLSELEARMAQRKRPGDRIRDKLAKAALYRELYLASEYDIPYIDNSNGRLPQALEDAISVVTAEAASNT